MFLLFNVVLHVGVTDPDVDVLFLFMLFPVAVLQIRM